MNKELKNWLEFSDEEIKSKINQMSDKEKSECFDANLEFGTAGIRGIIGIGPNRMNDITIAKAAYGYGRYIVEKFGSEASVVIGTDNRHKRKEFSDVTANILSSMGIRVYKQLIIPTPMVSFAIRDLKASGGVIITASHNPPEYNGFKVYDNAGGQLLPEETKKVLQYTSEREEFVSYRPERNDELISEIPVSTIENYKRQVLKIGRRGNKDLKIVFSPQHGTSANYIPNYLEILGFDVIRVKEQMIHDPDFINTPTPNPENKEAYNLSIEYAKKFNADIIITTDPDADRIGVAALDNGEYKILNGNEFAAIAFSELASTIDVKKPYMVYSYVSSILPALIAKKHNIESVPIATGFKWVSNVINKNPNKDFVFGFEESYGCLIDDNIARDKDSIQAAILISEIANKAKANNQSLWDVLRKIYDEFGYFKGTTLTKEFKGINSNKLREEYIAHLRKHPQLFTDREYKVIDLKDGMGEIAPMNMIRFEFNDGSWIGVRPSGTEPKIKFYMVSGPHKKDEIEWEFEKLLNTTKELIE